MKAASSKPRLGSRGQPEESRAAILQAAVREFAEHGIAGARTDAIATDGFGVASIVSCMNRDGTM